MKRAAVAASIAAAFFSIGAWAQWGPGMGPGMMQGYGPGGMGPWMMQGQGTGPAMGRGARGGLGMWGEGPWAFEALGLTEEQRSKIAAIQGELRRSHWAQMGAMQELREKAFDARAASDADALKTFDAMTALHRQMFQASLEARKRIDEVLTPEQREKLRKPARPLG